MSTFEQEYLKGFYEGRLSLLESLISDLKDIKQDTEVEREDEFGPDD